MDNILGVHNCYGCGVCAKVCGKNLISLRLNEDGFYEPFIEDVDRCASCGLCVQVCSYCDDSLAIDSSVRESYAAWSNDTKVLNKCSSGGIAFEIAKLLIEDGYNVCAVKYNAAENRAEHFIAHNKEELIQSAGSKYLQSYTIPGFLQIDKKKKYLVTGTPCQIDSFRRYIKFFRCEDNFVLLDFFCHGVPSMLMWKKYLNIIEKKTGKIYYASWRNKQTGWHDSWAMTADGELNGIPIDWHDSYNLLIREKKSYYNSRLSEGDLFYKMFLLNTCLGKACYDHCKYKMTNSSADIRVGDLWGKTYSKNQAGVSGVLVFTERGESVMQRLKQNNICNFNRVDSNIVMEGQMKEPAKKSLFWMSINKKLKTDASLNCIAWRYLYIIQLVSFVMRVLNKFKRMVK